MNFWGKTGGCREEEQEEKEQAPTTDRLFSSTSYHHNHHSRHQPEQHSFLPPPPHHHHRGSDLLMDVGEPSTNYEEEHRVGGMMIEREHMFDKVVTPSDVGKLNRLVIPKQHAERFFPLDSSNNDKGLQLNFEDRNGKLWRFRYSYWNSSQSYVMTKGWSRFVKEKKLDAGDVVSFQRGVGVSAKDRLFIDWRRRVNTSSPPHRTNLSFSFPHHNLFHPWNPLVLKSNPALPRRNSSLMLPPTNGGSRSVVYFRPGGGGTPQQPLQMIQMQQRNGFGVGVGVGVEIDPPLPSPSSKTPPLHGKASGKRLRLFGVNMDCPFSEDEDDQEDDPPTESRHFTVPDFSIINPISLGHCNYRDYHHGHSLNPPPSSTSSPPSSSIPYLQLCPYGDGNECNQSTILQPSSAHGFNIIAKSTASSMSLDLGI